jgi:ribosomal protein S18 acetylase RimI-like enzyme
MARTSDLPAIAHLLNIAFDNKNNNDREGIQEKLQQRMKDMKSSSIPHAFLIATTTSTEKSAGFIDLNATAQPIDGGDLSSFSTRIAGFMELGTMPSPISIEKEWNGVSVAVRTDLPYVANLVVDESMRRKKVGFTLIQLALKIAKKWCQGRDDQERVTLSESTSSSSLSSIPFLFLSVERENQDALRFYEKLGFETILLPAAKSSKSLRDKIYLKKDIL